MSTARRALPILALVATGLTAAVPAAAGGASPKDAEAAALVKKAIYSDYLETKFPDAEKKLKDALALCEPDKACSDKMQAKIHYSLGIVYIGGMSRRDDGRNELVAALHKDPSVKLDADLVSPEIEATFAEAKSVVAGGPAPAPTPAPGTTDAPAPKVPVAPVMAPVAPVAPAGQGDLVHTPPAEQAPLTPVPIYAELPPKTTAAKLQLGYKPFGSPAWKTVEMKPVGSGFGAEIPCLDVGSATGNLEYFVQAFDAESNLVSWSGTRAAPNRVPIKTELAGEAPHLPGQPPPSRCADPGDCPPEFPGCHEQKGDAPPPPVCAPGAECASAAKKNWVSLSVQQDLLVLGSSKTSCAGENEYACFDSSGTYYADIPYAQSGDELKGGLSRATIRILAGYDRVIGNFTLGTRLGVALGGGPQAPGGKGFFPFHGEARAAYWFGHDPFARTGLRPFLVVGGGVAQVDAKVPVVVYANQADYVADKRTMFDAWKKAGTGFVTAGAGALFAITPRMGPVVEVKYLQLLGVSSPALSLSLGYAVGF